MAKALKKNAKTQYFATISGDLFNELNGFINPSRNTDNEKKNAFSILNKS